ncbi:MAG: endolytic transglycosylase MltG [Cetobacterium sp.]|uniref:endolytic transglycosylase MltG n=1 Tax=Cetobacterium sp. TaxID=2071632 RepID=UPI003F2E9288
MKKIFLWLILGIILIACGSWFYYDKEINIKHKYNKILEIKSGEPVKKAFGTLGLDNNLIFKIYLKLHNEGKNIKAGYYQITGNYSMVEIINILESGKEKLFKLTIPEGYSNNEIIEILEKNGFGNKEKFEEASKEIKNFPYLTPNNNFEGYLYPNTYFIRENATMKDIIQVMLREFLKKFPSDKYPDKEEFYKKLIMASIIEREAKLPKEKPLMASVFYNRLKKNMTLSSDATVNYVYDYKKRRMYYKDLKIDSPYNTYKYKGLPPGPISNPDANSINAALNPAETDYLFFVAVAGDGSHYFTRTYKEHLEIQKKYRNNK